MNRWIGAGVVGVLLTGIVWAEEADDVRAFRVAKASLISNLRNPKPEKRLEAVQKLGEFPVAEAAKALLDQGTTSADPAVRAAAWQALQQFQDNSDWGAALKKELTLDLKAGNTTGRTSAAIGLLITSENHLAPREAEALLTSLPRSRSGMTPLLALVDEMGVNGGEGGLALIDKVRQHPLFGSDFALRRAITHAYIKQRRSAAIQELVGLLPEVQGEIRSDILLYLQWLSGQPIANEEDAAQWWKAAQTNYSFPDPRTVRPPVVSAGQPSYYGLPLYGSKIVFIIDVSGSMRGGRIEAAQRELIRAIDQLPERVEFNVLAFHHAVIAWQPALVMSSDESRQSAAEFVANQTLGSATVSYDALEAALTYPAESIYFLTDGEPHRGKITQPDQIVDVISKLNFTRRMTINAIGIGVGPDNGRFAQFLKALAARNYGAFRRIDG